jgi:GWxTD domain-containing protein
MRGLCALWLISVIAAGCGSAGGALPDCYSVARYKRLTQPSFDLYVMNVKAEKGSRIDLYVQMPYERMRFVKGDAGYAASYSVLFVFRGQDGESVQSREISRTVTAASYEATVSANADAFLQSVTLPPGDYMLEGTTVDQNSLTRFTQRTAVTAHDFAADSVLASTMLLLVKPRDDEKGTVLHPLLPQSVRYARDSIGVFQELYGVGRGDTIVVGMKYRMLSAAGRRAPRSDMTMIPPYVRFTASCTRGLDSLAHAARTVVVAGRGGTIPLIHYYPVPPVGYSEIERTVDVMGGSKTNRFISRMFLFTNRSVGPAIGEIADAMRYITREDEYDSLRTLGDSVRAGVIDRFWADHGGAARRNEFERRVDDADKLFSVCTEGSRTPMGITYIVCGPPDYVECRGFSSETWYYTVGTQTMSVPFRLERTNEEAIFYELPLNSVDEQLWHTYIDRWRRQ